MPTDYIVLAIPVFLLLIGLELLITRLLEKDYYRLSDSLADLACGMVQQLIEVLVKTLLFAGYLYVWSHARVWPIGFSPTAWLFCFLGVDLLYYWFHRLSHEVNAFWAAHVVHHQSEDYNLAVALRQGALQGWFSWVFYLPLAVLGFPPLMFLTTSSINTLYQFWIHTRVIGRLGPLEWVLNTPSSHRVHHGRNPKYIDRNHGGTLIVWDRLFGTYQAEEDEVVYGITTPLRSWSPIWANLHYWLELLESARKASRLGDKLRVFLKAPGWQPAERGGFVAAPEVDPKTYRKWEAPLPQGLGAYALVQFALLLITTGLLLRVQDRMGRGAFALAAAGLVASVAALAGLLERRAWAFALETARQLGLAAAAALVYASLPAPLVLGALLLGLVSLSWLFALRGRFTAPLPEAG
jgi:sterol desaturase/sphingolipid hydroxylase (fatty acid hydroxylase superfamily)